MSANSEKTQLTPSTVDYVTAAAKAALGAIPFAGSLLVELAGTFIPNQRIDRITKFAMELEARLANLEKDYIRSELSDERFSDLLEEGLRQAARSLTDERRRYIAALIANSLSSPDIEYHESRHLLRILNDLNDLEVIWLRFYLHPTISGDKEFRSKHEAILSPVFATMGSSQDVLDKSSLQDSYKQHMVQLGLLQPEYRIDSRTKQPEYDSFTGGQKLKGYRLSPLGKLLLRQIDLAGNDAP